MNKRTDSQPVNSGKSSHRDLALLGGTPAFDTPLHIGRPNIGDRRRLHERIDGILDSRWLTNDGPLVREWELRLADFMGVKHVVATCNGTAALEVTIRAMGLRGEVILPSFTFVATAHALKWLGLDPVFCDIDRANYNIDPAILEERITPQTNAIIGVHVFGRPCNVEALQEIADRHSLRLLFDAAHALGCSHEGTMIGSFGEAEIFSFHATKFINSFEGGAVATNDNSLAETMRLMRNFGFSGYDNVVSAGTNAKMTEIAAAMGLTSFEAIGEFIEINRRNFEQYQQELSQIAGLSLIDYAPDERGNFQYVVVEVDEDKAGLSRDQLVEILLAENVLARRYFYPGCHRMPPYHSGQGEPQCSLPVTDAIAARVFLLPTGTATEPRDIARIGDILRCSVENARTISPLLRQRTGTASP